MHRIIYGIPIGIVLALSVLVGGCSQTQVTAAVAATATVVKVTCTDDATVHADIQNGLAVAATVTTITDPALVAEIAALSATDQLAHAAVVAACTALGAMPVSVAVGAP